MIPVANPPRIIFGAVLGLGALLLLPTLGAAQTTMLTPTEQIEKLQDEIELLKVRVRLKETQLHAAKKTVEEYRRRLHTMQRANEVTPGIVSKADIAEMQWTLTTFTDQVEVREVELQEPLVRLKQAERRLARLQPRPPERTPAADGREQQENRLRELEKKVNQIIEELRKQRGEPQSKPKAPGQASASSPDDLAWRKLGLRFRPVGADAVEDHGPQFRGGLLVTEIRSDSPAARSGIKHDDILIGLDKFEVLSGDQVRYVLNHPHAATIQPLKFYVFRGGQLQSGRFQLGD